MAQKMSEIRNSQPTVVPVDIASPKGRPVKGVSGSEGITLMLLRLDEALHTGRCVSWPRGLRARREGRALLPLPRRTPSPPPPARPPGGKAGRAALRQRGG